MRELVVNHLNSLEHCTAYETLYLELASGAILRLGVGEVSIGGKEYLGKLKVTAPLRMSLTKASDNVSLEISNVNLALGQSLISQPNALDNCLAVFGAYFKNNDTDEEWHDEKLPGEIVASAIDGDKIVCSFLSDLDAAQNHGRLIADIFSNAQLLRNPTPIDNNGGGSGGGFGGGDVIDSRIARKLSVLTDEMGYGRYNLPEFNLVF